MGSEFISSDFGKLLVNLRLFYLKTLGHTTYLITKLQVVCFHLSFNFCELFVQCFELSLFAHSLNIFISAHEYLSLFNGKSKSDIAIWV